jgi:Domain of unknown function (DUF4410)
MTINVEMITCERFDLKSSSIFVRLTALIGATVALGGCATAKVANVASAQVSNFRPSEVLVEVRPAMSSGDPNVALASKVSEKLQVALIKKLTKSRITAEAYAPGEALAGAATLRVTITRADPGNAVERFLIGFGFGQAKLQASAEFDVDKAVPAQSMTTFVISSHSGYKPGLVLPGSVAAATGDAIHLAIGGGIDVAMSIPGGMSRPVRATTNAIVGQLEKYYAQIGWHRPVRA